MRQKILQAEKHLEAAWEMYQVGGQGKMLKPFGKLLARVVLHLCEKEKMVAKQAFTQISKA